MKYSCHFSKFFRLAVAACSCFPALVLAQNNPNYALGDLVLHFQQEGGANTIYANLGSAALLYRGTASGPGGAANRINFLDISAELEAAFGAGWASDPSIYAGLAGVFSTGTLSSAVTDGDPQRTVYVSRQRSEVGTVGQASSATWTVASSGGMSSAAGGIFSMNNILEITYATAVAVSPIGVSFIDNQHPFLTEGIQGNAYETFAGGVQQAGAAGSFGSFGAAGTVEFALDLYRILARDTGTGLVTGPLRVGTYEGTVTINSAGLVSFVSQGAAPASNYDAWVTTFNPPLTNASDRLAEADPDIDGIENVLEFVLNGDPTVNSQSILPTLNATGTDFVFSFTRRADSAAEITQVFEYSSDLVDWTTNTPVTIPTAPGGSGVVVVGLTTGTAPNEIQTVTLTIPKGASTKLFGRLRAVK